MAVVGRGKDYFHSGHAFVDVELAESFFPGVIWQVESGEEILARDEEEVLVRQTHHWH